MKYLFFLLTFLPLAVFSQSENQLKPGKFSIGLTYSPDYAYRVLKPVMLETVGSLGFTIAEIMDSQEIPKYGFTTGLNMAFRYSSRLSFETGLLFSNKGKRTRDIYFKHSSDQEEPEIGRFITDYLYLDIPIKAKYHFTDGRAKIFVAAGFSSNIFLFAQDNIEFTNSDGVIENKTVRIDASFKKVNLAVIAGFGLSYDISRQLYFKIEPTYRRSITSIVNNYITTHLYSAGIDVGLFYAF
jgi:opacity protein-like surface antigen